MSKKDWETDGYRNGKPIYCPIIAYGDCPYCDEYNLCHIADPVEECDDFMSYFESWDEWLDSDDGCENCDGDCFACGNAEFVYD